MPETVAMRRGFVLPAVLALLGPALSPAGADEADEALRAAKGRGGLVVLVGCGDGPRAAALGAGGRCIVHVLHRDAACVAALRRQIAAAGPYGRVSADGFDGRHLPYAENLVNLVVAEDPADVPAGEFLRVLAPGGAALVRRGGRWERTVKGPLPGADEWTHYLHDAAGNAVSRDRLVGPPGRIQWLAAPRHTRSHEHIPSIYALVSSGGRVFYLADEAPVASVRTPPRWRLLARDAFNGALLWRRDVGEWFPHIVNWGRTPRDLQRRLVAVGGRVYVTLGLHAPVSALDAATGRTVRVYEGTAGTEEILLHRGVLLLAWRDVTPQRQRELEKMLALTRRGKSPLDTRESAEPLVGQFRKVESRGARAVLALDAETGAVRWKKTSPEASGLRPMTLCAVGGRVYYQAAGGTTCVDLADGRTVWQSPVGPMQVVGGGVVVCGGGQNVLALSAESGKVLWKQPAVLCQLHDAFVIRGSLWLGGFKPLRGRDVGKRGPSWGPYYALQYDLKTGRVLREIAAANPGHHHRCWKNKATERYILAGRRGVEFYDLAGGEVLWHSWVRGVCKYGVMPANGLLYAPPHACACYLAAKLAGFYALAPRAGGQPAPGQAVERLARGPAFAAAGQAQPPRAQPEPPAGADWPTYRHDPARSGTTARAVPAKLRRLWQARPGGHLTPPTVAEGKVFVASIDAHTVCALDAATGRAAWRFTAGGRVDLPPTVHRGRALFGSRDGCVYSVRTADGALAWRLRAARADRRIVARGQVESVWPAHGSVLVRGGQAWVLAGRSSYLDGGMDLHRVEPRTGRILSTTTLYSPDPDTGRQPEQFGPASMPGDRADVLTADGRFVYLRRTVLDANGAVVPKGSAHLLTLTGFLDDTWAHRSYWIFGVRCAIRCGCSGRDRNLTYGRLLAFDERTVYGYGRADVHWSNPLRDGPYRIFARPRGSTKYLWTLRAGIDVRAMVVAGPTLFAAGTDPAGGATVLAVSADSGRELARFALPAGCVFDGLAAAGGRLYAALLDGSVVALAGAGAGGPAAARQ